MLDVGEPKRESKGVHGPANMRDCETLHRSTNQCLHISVVFAPRFVFFLFLFFFVMRRESRKPSGTSELPVAFSLDNGVVIQEVLSWVLSHLPRTERKMTVEQEQKDPLAIYRALFHSREMTSMWWEARTVAVMTWSSKHTNTLKEILRFVVVTMQELIVRAPEPCSHRRTPLCKGSLDTICKSCMHQVMPGSLYATYNAPSLIQESIQYKCFCLDVLIIH